VGKLKGAPNGIPHRLLPVQARTRRRFAPQTIVQTDTTDRAAVAVTSSPCDRLCDVPLQRGKRRSTERTGNCKSRLVVERHDGSGGGEPDWPLPRIAEVPV
jgi:hypothetical protein